MRTATLRGDVDSRLTNTAAVLGKLTADYLPELKEKFAGVDFAIEGETAESAKTAGSIQRGLLIGLIGVFILELFVEIQRDSIFAAIILKSWRLTFYLCFFLHMKTRNGPNPG